jgi:hypothetical protein
MSTSKDAANDRARQYIDDVLKIYADYGVPRVESQETYDSAVAAVTRASKRIARVSPAAER